MKRYLRIFYLVPLFFLTGCYPVFKFDMDGLEPAQLNVSQTVSSLTILARADLDSLYKSGRIQSGKKAVFDRDSSIVHEAVNGCKDGLLNSPRFVIYDPVIRRNLVGDFSDADRLLPWKAVQAVAGEPPVDAVLALESVEMKDTVVLRQSDGWIFSDYRILIKSSWRLYNLKQYTVSNFIFSDTLNNDLGYSPDPTVPSDIKLTLIKQAMYEAGQSTARRLAPYWIELDRIYFPYGSESYAKAADYMEKGNWQKAAEIWSALSKSKNKTLRAKVCFNMAVTCELAGNMPMALVWLKESEKNGMAEYFLTDYRAKLADRIKKNVKLDQQMKNR
jgi:hypothetical protein